MIIENVSQKPDSERIIRWIEEYLVVPDGENQGQPFKLMDFQKHFIQHAFDGGYSKSLLSMPRGNAKTTLIASIALAVASLNIDKDVVGMSVTRSQAAIVFQVAAMMIGPNIKGSFNILTHRAQIKIPSTDATISFNSLDTSFAYKGGLIVFDELGMLQKLPFDITGTFIAISTKGSKPNNAFAQLCEQAKTDPNIMLIEYSCPQDMNPFGLAAWKMANPMYEHQNKEYVMRAILEARDNAEKEAAYRLFHLNQGVIS